jgi:prophage tail gpP-like protein
MATPRPENVVLRIDGKEWEGWTSLEVCLQMDSFSTVQFEAPFEPERLDFRETFRPFTFKRVEVLSEQTPLFTGTMMDVDPNVDASSRTVTVTAYALPAVLGDCTAPGATVPHEFKKVGIREIATQLLQPYGLSLRVPPGVDLGAVFAKAKLEEGEKVFEFLVNLIQQRTLILSNTPEGELLCWKSIAAGNPRARLIGGEPPIGKITPAFSPQDYFSEITGFGPTRRRGTGGKWTEKNPWLKNVLRSHSFKLDNTEKGDAPTEARNKLARMFANMASWSVEDVPTWRDPQGDLWEPNTTHLVTAPDAMIYRESELLVRKVTLKQDADSYTADIDWVLPGVFSGEIPTELPWNE